MMDILSGTPYLLSADSGQMVVRAAEDLHEEVSLLRRNGALDALTLGHLRKEWRFKQIYESAGIEGNELSLSETQLAIQQGITISGKPTEHSDEVRRLNDALDYLEELASSSNAITEWEIRQVQLLVLGRGEKDAGAYRNVEVAITNSPHKPPNPIQVPDYMRDYASWIQNSQYVPVPLLAAVAHAWLVHIHPFRDGNGRTARAMMNLLLMRHGYPIVVIRRTDRQRYYEALRLSDDGDITPLLELLIDRCQDSLQQIDRARTAATGVSLALQKVREQEELKYRAWADGIRLFGSTLEDVLKQVEIQDASFTVKIVRYDVPAFEDYQGICSRNSGCNTWFRKLQVSHHGIQKTVLLRIGHSTDDAMRLIGTSGPIPTIKLSVPKVVPPPTWILATDDFPSLAREFAYRDGKYFRVNGTSPATLVEVDNVVELSNQFVTELIEGWFAK